ncbi:MAG: aminoacyl-tRNA hydrolase [Cohaesibacter sp.]|jgi:PTH1 family peptidyl-tRNA hydrolase|nr:aminoacyl-tRNA hydrolase [Cohaesibacter sp.]
MYLLVGLGNPGPKYTGNRHNIGFMAIDEIARQHNFGPWRKKFQGEVCEGLLGGEKTLLLKPQTYMNESGRAVSEACRFYKIPPKDVFVFHDELDLKPGKVKAKLGGGAAGHNGLRSTGNHIGNDYHRIRLGIGHPGKDLVTQWVLGDFAKADQSWLDPVLDALGYTAPSLIKGDLGRYMTDFNHRLNPPASSAPKAKKPSSDALEKNKAAPDTSSKTQNETGKKTSATKQSDAPKTAMAEALLKLVSKHKD